MKKFIFNKKLLYCDIVMIACFVLMLAVRLLTLAIFSHISVDSGAEITAVNNLYESNPIAKLMITGIQMQFILFTFILPALALATYFYYRAKVKANKLDIDILCFFVNFAFFVFIINIVNDGAIYLGKIL